MAIEKTIKPNEEQEKCIKSNASKLLVVAGPGTGKTYTVVEKIKYLISKNVNPERILCLTFSDTGATEMRNRVRKELNNQSLKINIYTYHGFCNELISEEPEAFGIADNFRVISNAMATKLLKESITEVNPESFRGPKNNPLNRYAFTTIQNMVKKFKKYNMTTKEQFDYNFQYNPAWKIEYERLLDNKRFKEENNQKVFKYELTNIEKMEKMFQKAKDAWEVYVNYQNKLGIYIDYDDMINNVLNRFKDDSVYLHEVSQKYDYIIVDEYQDTNPNQNELIFLLTDVKDDGNLFVVCDDDQIIYGFQGARIDTIDKFIEKYSPENVCLIKNMRSTQNILDAAHIVAKEQDPKYRLEGKNGINKQLKSVSDDVKDKNIPVRVYAFSDNLQENNNIATEIKELMDSDKLPLNDKGEKLLSEIAILAKSHEELYVLADFLRGKGVPYELKEGKSIFNIRASQVLYNYMQFLVNPDFYADKFFKLMLSQPFIVNAKDFQTLSFKKYQYDCELKDNGKTDFENFMEYIIAHSDKNEYVKWDNIQKIFSTYKHLLKYKSVETLKNVVIEIGNKTNIFKHYIEIDENKVDNVAGFQKLVDEAIDFSDAEKKISLEYYVEYLELCESDEKLAIKTDESPFTKNAVQLLTYHGSKGREFDYVYMPNLTEANWEGRRVVTTPDIPLPPSEYKTEEEIKLIAEAEHAKLFYVGMTRARHTLRLSYPKGIDETNLQNPTKFISCIYDMCEHEKTPFEYKGEEFYRSEQAKVLLQEEYDYNKDFCLMVDAKSEKMEYSATSMNTYNDCPRRYLYDYIFNLSSNGDVSNALSYGKIIHATCEYAVKQAIKNKQHISKEEFINKFYEEMKNPDCPMANADDYKIHKGRGEKALNEYYVQLTNTNPNNFYAAEKEIKFTDTDGIKFKGYIDRIDTINDNYVIYDYKTGSAKAGDKICEGGEYENYYYQIALYKYIFEQSEKQAGRKCNVSETTFIFPEECTKNYTAPIDNESCLKVVQKYKEIISKIKSYNFNPTPRLKEKTCEYCPHKDICPKWNGGRYINGEVKNS